MHFTGLKNLTEYTISDVTMDTNVTSSGNSLAVVRITLDRKIAYHLTGTFFQCFVLTGVGYLTMFFAIDNFTDRIMVALTTMLVQATVSNAMQDVNLNPSEIQCRLHILKPFSETPQHWLYQND